MQMVQAVGEAACREAAAFLEACAERLEPRLQTFGKWRRIRRRLTGYWSLDYKSLPEDKSQRSVYVGVWIDENFPAIVPWIWCRGGRHAGDEVIRILGQGIKPRSGDLQLDPGTVALARIPIPIAEGPQAFEVDRDPLVAQVYQAFEALNASKLKKIASLSIRFKTD
jgi:hypothetical protein